jgi:hypothetical protein
VYRACLAARVCSYLMLGVLSIHFFFCRKIENRVQPVNNSRNPVVHALKWLATSQARKMTDPWKENITKMALQSADLF